MSTMKNNLIKEIEKTVADNEAITDFLEEAKSLDFTKRTNKLKLSAITMKKVMILLKGIILSEFLEAEFGETYPFEGDFLKQKEEYTNTLKSLDIKDGKVVYSSEYEDLINNLENSMNGN